MSFSVEDITQSERLTYTVEVDLFQRQNREVFTNVATEYRMNKNFPGMAAVPYGPKIEYAESWAIIHLDDGSKMHYPARRIKSLYSYPNPPSFEDGDGDD